MNTLLEKLNINEEFTKGRKKQKVFNKIKNNVPLLEDCNFMADLLELPLTKSKYRYLVVVVDLASDEFDIEPITKKDSDNVLKAMLKMFKRNPNFIKIPYASLRTDGGSKFQGVFHKWLY